LINTESMSFWSNFNKPAIHKDWSVLSSVGQLDEILEESNSQKVAILKHSTRCGISYMVKDQLESTWDIPIGDLKLYYLDLLAHRDVSDEVARRLRVVHQSPQIIVIHRSKAIYNTSHHAINLRGLKSV